MPSPFLLLGAALLLVGTVRGQSTPDTLLAANQASAWRVSSLVDSVGECSEVLSWGTSAALVRTFHPGGQLHEYVPFANLALGVRHGMSSEWYPDGQAARLDPFVEGRREGELVIYYADGRLKRQASFRAGTELSGCCYDPAGQPLAYFPYEQPPLYPGGMAQLNQEINQHLRRVRTSAQLYIAGPILVSVSFLVDPNGRLSEPRIEVPSRVPNLDQAIVDAVLKLSRPWQPGRRDGQLVAFRYRLPIQFAAPRPPSYGRAH